jgi:hypothetical protein
MPIIAGCAMRGGVGLQILAVGRKVCQLVNADGVGGKIDAVRDELRPVHSHAHPAVGEFLDCYHFLVH